MHRKRCCFCRTSVTDAFDDTRINPKREFFQISPERVVAALKLAEIENITPRKKWDEQSFFEDVRKNSGSEAAAIIRKLYDFSKNKSKISWGTGVGRGAFSAQFDLLGTKPLFVLESNGILRISFEYPKKEASAGQIAKIKVLELLISKTGMQVEKSTNRTVFEMDEWRPMADSLISSIKSVCD